MRDVYVFRRVEKKYRINVEQKERLMAIIGHRVTPDAHGKSTVCSLYLDTPDHLLIRKSIEEKFYKEKLRLRCYGVPSIDTKVFLEIKKKYKGIVYKRREAMELSCAYGYLESGEPPRDTQIMREIDYMMRRYNYPKPSMLVAYEREAYFDENYGHLRITFDSNIRYRCHDLRLENGNDGTKILPDDQLILEIKTDASMPLWLSAALDECEIFPSSFSKYGTSYKHTLEQKGEISDVSNF